MVMVAFQPDQIDYWTLRGNLKISEKRSRKIYPTKFLYYASASRSSIRKEKETVNLKSSLKKVVATATSTLVIAGLVASAAPAHASEKPVNIVGYNVKDLVISSDADRLIYPSAKVKKQKDFRDFSAMVSLTRGGVEEMSTWFYGTNASQMVVEPSRTGLGQYRIGPADIDASYWVNKKAGHEEYSDYYDLTETKFYVRGKTKSSLKAQRKGSKVTLTAKATVFSPERDSYIKYNAKNAAVQVKSGKKWKTVKKVNLKKGQAVVKLTDKKAKTYRVVMPKATWAIATTTNTVKK